MITEQKACDVGGYCQILLEDKSFEELVDLCRENLAVQMLEANSPEEREGYHRTNVGLNELINMMHQFVSVKDQIVAKNEESND